MLSGNHPTQHLYAFTAEIGTNIDDGPGVPTAGYAYPVFVAAGGQDADLVYNMTKAMVELYDGYKGNAPGINGWSLDKQNFEWVAPYHDGAIKYYKEIGKWSDSAQTHNDTLIARQPTRFADVKKTLDLFIGTANDLHVT